MNIEPHITSIRYYSGPVRKKPQHGDRRFTKKHGEQVRVFSMAKDHMGRVIGFNCTGGRQNYEWVSPVEAYKRYPHLKDKHTRMVK